MNEFHSDSPEDFDRELSLLSESHPGIERLELDRAKLRSRAMARRPRRRAWARFARSRTAVVAAITTGALMSSGATALGVSGLASGGNASTAQYGLTPPGNGSLGTTGNGTPPGSGVSPSSGAGNAQAVTPEEEVAQAGPSTQGQLPFTGLALIPILVVGLVLLMTGLVARRRAGRPAEPPPAS